MNYYVNEWICFVIQLDNQEKIEFDIAIIFELCYTPFKFRRSYEII